MRAACVLALALRLRSAGRGHRSHREFGRQDQDDYRYRLVDAVLS
ncbi:MAG: hypothetical protein ACLVB4_11485 [Butyricicoccus sp.]